MTQWKVNERQCVGPGEQAEQTVVLVVLLVSLIAVPTFE